MRKAYIRITSIILITIMLLSMTLTAFAEEPSNIDASQMSENITDTDEPFTEDDIPKEVEDQLMAQFNEEEILSDNVSSDSKNTKPLASIEAVSVSSDKEESEPIPEEDLSKLDNVKIVNNTISTALYDGTTISISGRMPKDAVVEAVEVFDTDSLSIDENLSIIKAYDIKILSNGEYFQPEDIDSEVKVSIKLDDLKEAVAETVDETVPVNEETITLLHIDDKENVTEVEDIKVTNDTVSFDTDSFSVYVLATNGKYSEITTTMTSSKTTESVPADEELSTTVTFSVDRDTDYPIITKHLDFEGYNYRYTGYEIPSGQDASAVTVTNVDDLGCDISLDYSTVNVDSAKVTELQSELAEKQALLTQKMSEISSDVRYSHTNNISDDGTATGTTYGSKRDVITIPGASSLHVELTYSLEDYYHVIYAFQGTYTNTLNGNQNVGELKSYKNLMNDSGIHPLSYDSFDVVGDTVTLALYTPGSYYNTGTGYGYYAIVTPDDQAEIIKEISSIKKRIEELNREIELWQRSLSVSVILKFKPVSNFTEELKQEKITYYTNQINSKYAPLISTQEAENEITAADLQSQIDTLNEQKAPLTEQKNTLNSQKTAKQNELNASIKSLQSQYNTAVNDYIAANPDKVTLLDTKYSHTANVSDAGVKNSDYSHNLQQKDVVTIPGASSLHASLTYGTENNYDWVIAYKGEYSSDVPSAKFIDSAVTSIKNDPNYRNGGTGPEPDSPLEFDIEGNTVTFLFRSDYSGVGSGLGYYAVVSGYNFNEEAQQYISQLQSQLESDIQSATEENQPEIDALTEQIASLNTQITTISNQLSSLTTQKNNLVNLITALEAKRDAEISDIEDFFEQWVNSDEYYTHVLDKNTNGEKSEKASEIMLQWLTSTNASDPGYSLSLAWDNLYNVERLSDKYVKYVAQNKYISTVSFSYTVAITVSSGQDQSGIYPVDALEIRLPYYAFGDSIRWDKGEDVKMYESSTSYRAKTGFDPSSMPIPSKETKTASDELYYELDLENNEYIIRNNIQLEGGFHEEFNVLYKNIKFYPIKDMGKFIIYAHGKGKSTSDTDYRQINIDGENALCFQVDTGINNYVIYSDPTSRWACLHYAIASVVYSKGMLNGTLLSDSYFKDIPYSEDFDDDYAYFFYPALSVLSICQPYALNLDFSLKVNDEVFTDYELYLSDINTNNIYSSTSVKCLNHSGAWLTGKSANLCFDVPESFVRVARTEQYKTIDTCSNASNASEWYFLIKIKKDKISTGDKVCPTISFTATATDEDTHEGDDKIDKVEGTTVFPEVEYVQYVYPEGGNLFIL